jgi:hypothetical protein
MSKYPGKHPEADAKHIMCGSCFWFTAGFDGKNCQKLRTVEVTTPACIEFTLPLEDPFIEITKDKYISGIREVLRSNKFKIDESILQELRSYVIEDNFAKNRFGTQQDLEAMNLTLKRLIQHRARLSNIFTSLIDIRHEFDELIDHSHLWLYSKYSIIRDLKSENMRKTICMRILPETIAISKQLEKYMATAKYIENHLECNEQTLIKILNSSEKLWFSRERVGGTLKSLYEM